MRTGWWSASVLAFVMACGAAAQTGSSPEPSPPGVSAATPDDRAPQDKAPDPARQAQPDAAQQSQETQAPAPAEERPNEPAAEPAAPETAAPPSTAAPAPSTPPPPAAAAPPAPPQPATASVLDKHLIQGVLGKDVRSSKDEDMGRIVDVIVDYSGQTRAAVIDFGGFLGVGSRRIAVAWNALHFAPDQANQVTLDLTRDQLKAAPEYKEGKPVVVLGPSGNTETVPDN
jgi:hypothetical protein